MASKECQDCAVDGRGKIVIKQKDKKAGGSYWANPDGSPHYFHTGDEGNKPQFVHPRTSDEFNWAKEHNGMNECPTYKTPFEKLGNKIDTPAGWEPWLGPASLETEAHQHAIADTNNYMQNIRLTCWNLAKDLYPPDADVHSIRITACGFIHDFIHMYAAAKIKEDLLKVERVVEDTMQLLKKKP